MIFERIKQEAMKAAMSPATMKLLSDPRIQKVMMRAIQLPSDVRDALEKNGQNIAKTFSLVTKEDMRSMKRTIKDLKAQIEKLNSDLEAERQKSAQVNRTKETSPGPAKSSKSVNETKGAAKGRKTIKVKRKAATPVGKKTTPKPAAKKKITVKRKVKVTAKKK